MCSGREFSQRCIAVARGSFWTETGAAMTSGEMACAARKKLDGEKIFPKKMSCFMERVLRRSDGATLRVSMVARRK